MFDFLGRETSFFYRSCAILAVLDGDRILQVFLFFGLKKINF